MLASPINQEIVEEQMLCFPNLHLLAPNFPRRFKWSAQGQHSD